MIEVTRYYEQKFRDKNGVEKSYFYADVILNDRYVVRRICHMQGSNGKWFKMPNFCEEGENGEKKWMPYFEFKLAAHNTEFFEKLNEAVKAFQNKNNIDGDLPF